MMLLSLLIAPSMSHELGREAIIPIWLVLNPFQISIIID
jgi:hypothetical protein